MLPLVVLGTSHLQQRTHRTGGISSSKAASSSLPVSHLHQPSTNKTKRRGPTWKQRLFRRSNIPIRLEVRVLLLAFTCGFFGLAVLRLISKSSSSGKNAVSSNALEGVSVSVFYHIYIPTNKGKRGYIDTSQIIEEQIHQIARAAESSGANIPWTIYYNTVGATKNQTNELISHRWIENDICARRRHFVSCQQLRPHMRIGGENVTLQDLHQHCYKYKKAQDFAQEVIIPAGRTKPPPPKNVMIYLHTKGTYHSDHGRNHAWRRSLTEAATHKSCLEELTAQKAKCNVCGFQMYPLWTSFLPGNMFATTCDYVGGMREPGQQFEQLMQKITEYVRHHSNWTHDLYNFDNPGNVGTERYAAEHWIGSSPQFLPCDFQGNETTIFSERLRGQELGDMGLPALPKVLKSSMFRSSPPRDTFLHGATAQPAPRVSLQNGNWFRLNHSKVRHLAQSGKMEYFLLPGLLFRHRVLYKKFPPKHNTWIWDWFPDGHFWQRQIYNNNTRDRNNTDMLDSLWDDVEQKIPEASFDYKY